MAAGVLCDPVALGGGGRGRLATALKPGADAVLDPSAKCLPEQARELIGDRFDVNRERLIIEMFSLAKLPQAMQRGFAKDDVILVRIQVSQAQVQNGK